MPIRIMIVDDHSIVRSGLESLLTIEPGIEVVGVASSGIEALTNAQLIHPDVVLMDLNLGEMDGLEATKLMLEACPAVKVLVLTMYEDSEMLRAALSSGASGYITKQASKSELINAIHAVQRDEMYIHSALTRTLISPIVLGEESPCAELEVLTNREIEVLKLLVKGNTNQQIAGELVISKRTVEFHRKNIQEKLNIHSRVGLMRYASEKGLV